MTAVAIGLGILELQGKMALLTGHRHMQTQERKFSKVMIELHRSLRSASPGVGHMTLTTVGAQLPGMGILCSMATDAGGTQFLRGHIRGMAGIATEPFVRTRQRKLGIALMRELHRTPLGAVMTLLAARIHAACMHIL